MTVSKFAIAGILAVGLGLATAGSASAQWGPYHHHRYYGYYGYRPAVVVAPPAVVVAPAVVAPAPTVVVPAAPAVVTTAVVAPPVIVGPAYRYPYGYYGGIGYVRPGISIGIGFGGWR